MEIFVILFLILLNALFAMAEIAIISSRKSKLQQQANEDSKGAQAALELSKSPNRLLSTVQIGITFIGIFTGAFSGDTIASNLAAYWQGVPFIGPYSKSIAFFLVVTIVTYLSLVIGELVPKRLALINPEKIARVLGRPMQAIASFSDPLVSLLSSSTDWILRLLQIKTSNEPAVSHEEVRLLLQEGARAGIFETAEKDIVDRTLKLGDKKVRSFMISRQEIVWLDVDSQFRTLRHKIAKASYSHFPVCRDSLDKILGVVRTKDILTNFMVEERIDLRKYLHKPLFIPESMDGLKVLELFKKTGIHMALVVDEYGQVQGLVSLNDIPVAIVGDIPTINELEEQEITKRENGTFLVDGLVSIDDFKEYFHLKKLPEEKSGVFHTIGGFVMHRLNRIPVTGDTFDLINFRFEVMDMDGNRVDKVMVVPLKGSEG